VCPDCQRTAAVGVQCVDCVRVQSKTTRSARTVFGGQVGTGAARVTQTLIGVCIVAFVLQLGAGDRFTQTFSYAPEFTISEPWRMVTAAFLHSPRFLLHILFNLYALGVIGPYLERLLGPLRFATLYLLSAFGGSVGYFVLANPDSVRSWRTATVGATGAIFGLFAALMLVNRRLGRDSAGILAVIVINGVLGFMPNLNIAWQAHMGGLITGGLVAAILVYAPPEQRSRLHPFGISLVAVLLVALTVIKIGLVPAELFA
jgi:membrane associated rhomboid family serine protease